MGTRLASYTWQTGLTVQLFVTDCAECGVVFAVTVELEKRRRQTGERFYCPNGHTLVFREIEADRLRKESDRQKDLIAQLDRRVANAQEDARAAHASLVATKGHLTRVKRRADAGVCQHCNRSFANVARHVEHMHPEAVRA